MADLVQGRDYRHASAEFRTSFSFWALMVDARGDLTEAVRHRANHPAMALSLVLHDDLAAPEGTKKRDQVAIQKVRSVRGSDSTS